MRGILSLLLTLVVLALSLESISALGNLRHMNQTVTKVAKQSGKKIYIHLMPWFETRETSEDGQWGIHWKMASQNPDIIDGSGRRQIASKYYPEIGPYGSGDGALIDYQILAMKYSGVDGVLIDWPGTTKAWDYPKNDRNADAFISRLEGAGLEFAIVYEDHNLGMAAEAGIISDILAQGRQDMSYLQSTYFGRPNHIRINGAPLLMTFGPQSLTNPSDWESVFSVLNPKPTFLTLWYQQEQAAGNAKGEYAWIYFDFMDGLINFYNNRPNEVKMGVAYPGFDTFYQMGGWPGPDWSIPHNGLETFTNTLNAALSSPNVNWIQCATWNDYGEGTQIEPTLEFGNGFLNVLQNSLQVPYGNRELGLVKEYYLKRKAVQGLKDGQKEKILDAVYEALNGLNPDEAEALLKTL